MHKQIIAILGTTLLLALGMAACAPEANLPAPSKDAAQVPNPITEYATIEEAEAVAGFDIKAPSGLPEGYAVSRIAVIAGAEGAAAPDGDAGADEDAATERDGGIGAPGGAKAGPVIEVTYANGSDAITYRAAQGDAADLSGDYEEYAENNTRTAGGVEVHTRGENGKVNVATWSAAGLSHSLTAGGLAAGEVDAIVGSAQ